MYALLWRRLPGPLWARLLVAAAIVAAVIALCFTMVFPAVDAWTSPPETFGH